MGTEKRDAQFIDVAEPQFITLTKRPANKTAFKVLRDANGAEKVIRRRKKVNRSDSGLIAIELPLGTTEEEAVDCLEKYCLGEEYSVVGDEENGFLLTREATDTEQESVRLDLGEDAIAIVAASTFKRSEVDRITGLTLVGVEFTNDFSEESAKEWLASNEIVYMEGGLSTDNGLCTAVRYEVPNNQETRRVSIEDGVTGLIARTESVDIPEKVYRSVIEEAYGNWGWGSLDFSQAVADATFSDLSRESIWVLHDVIENILFYSYLPIDERKSLVSNACDQFSNYIASLIEALPREVAVKARADRTTVNQETEDMGTKDTKGTTTKRSDASNKVDDGDKKETINKEAGTEGSEAPEYITRADLKEILTEQFSPEVIKDMFGAAIGMKRAEENEDTTDPTLAAIESLGETMRGIAEKVVAMEESQTAMRGDLDELGGVTLKRTDEEENETAEEQGERLKREDGGVSVFRGIFG